jgi:hypothetical protein
VVTRTLSLVEANDDLPVDVLTELGRVTWAAIVLDDSAKWLCSSIQPVHPRTDRRPMSERISDALGALKDWPDSPGRDQARAWLIRARQALETRKGLLHATPLVWVGELPDGQSVRQLLGEMPHKRRPYYERPMSVEALSEVRDLLVEAKAGWRDVMLGTAEARARDADDGSGRHAEPS